MNMPYKTFITLLISIMLSMVSSIAVAQEMHPRAFSTVTPKDVQKAIIEIKDVNATTKSGWTPLMYAARDSQHKEIIEALITAGANIKAVNEDGITPLMFAAAKNENVSVLDALIKAGSEIDAKDHDEMTALMAAAGLNKNPAVTRALLKAGASLEERDEDGWLPLHFAVSNNPNIDVLKAILRDNQINAVDNNKMTPLMLAAKSAKNPEIISILLKAGANPSMKDKAGRTALDYAQQGNNKQVIAALQKVTK